MDYKYKIGDKTYYQKPVVLGQIKQLEEFLKDFIVPGNFSVTTLMSMLGDKFPYALAIILIEEGKSLSDRFHLIPFLGGDKGVGKSEIRNPKSEIAGMGNFGYEPIPEIMNQIALDIAISNDLETSIKVIEDFFVCNPTASVFQRLSGIISALGIGPHCPPLEGAGGGIGLTNSASSSPTETSPGETTSSGDTPLPNASRISNTASVT